MTNLLQPADVGWFAAIKKAYHEKWNEWSINTIKQRTLYNNTKSPGYALAIQWISDIWRDFDPSKIKNSFEYCGITSQDSLHSVLKKIYEEHRIMNSYIDINTEEDDILGFDNFDSDLFDDGQFEQYEEIIESLTESSVPTVIHSEDVEMTNQEIQSAQGQSLQTNDPSAFLDSETSEQSTQSQLLLQGNDPMPFFNLDYPYLTDLSRPGLFSNQYVHMPSSIMSNIMNHSLMPFQMPLFNIEQVPCLSASVKSAIIQETTSSVDKKVREALMKRKSINSPNENTSNTSIGSDTSNIITSPNNSDTSTPNNTSCSKTSSTSSINSSSITITPLTKATSPDNDDTSTTNNKPCAKTSSKSSTKPLTKTPIVHQSIKKF